MRGPSIRLLGLLVAVVAATILPVSVVGAQLPTQVVPPIREIIAPLAGIPAIQRATEPLVIELDPDLAPDPIGLAAALRPSFGLQRPPISLGPPRNVELLAESETWPGRTVHRAVFHLPPDPWLVKDLYDIEVTWNSGSDIERRAVKIVDEHPEVPRIVVIADPSVGDPRPVQEGLQDALQGDPDSLFAKIDGTVGDVINEPRWAALNRAVNEINLVQPDFVLVAGDLTFLAHPNTAPYEYLDAYTILDRLEVPTFLTPGNHDLYALDDYTGVEGLAAVDGWEAWLEWFGPHHWSTDIGPDFHLVSINTFDWQDRTPFPPPEFPTLAGANIRDEQWAWLVDDLLAARAANPDGHVVTFAHHDPSMFGNRHNWPGARRYETRDLLAEAGVDAHFSGHTHEDRVARYYEGGTVQTSGRPHMGHPVGVLSHVLRDGDALDDQMTEDALGEILHEPSHGPLFVSTTTAASGLVGEDWGLGGWWGWRLALLERHDNGYDPVTFGYPATAEFIEQRAAIPGNWNADHAEYGVFSHPSYDLDLVGMEGNDGTAPYARAQLSSNLLTDIEVTLRLVAAGVSPDRLRASGGTIDQLRTVGGVTTAWVRGTVPAGEVHTLSLATGDEPAAGPADPGSGAQPGTETPSTGLPGVLVALALLALGVATSLAGRTGPSART